MNSWWTLAVETCLTQLKTDAAHGLSDEEAQRRLAATGPNMLVEHGAKSPWVILAEQFTSIMVIILIIAAVVSAFMGEFADAIVIGIIVILNALLGLTQEYRAEKAMAALKRMAVPTVKVRRGGDVREISSRDLAPGDIVILETGNLVPADCRLLEAVNLRIQEATLTGESEPVEKNTESLAGASIPIGDRRNMAYMGTIVTYGRGLALAVETGMRTELGSIATMIQGVKREPTPLQKRLEQLGKGLALAALAIVIVIFAEGLIRDGVGIENVKLMFLTAISMAVAAVPEGLPAVVTITLALGAQRMLRRRALIRKLLAVETLGSVTVICSDKTGTLTENRMTVTVVDVAGHRIDLTELQKHNGSVRPDTDAHVPIPPAHSGLAPLLAASALCNDAVLKSGAAPQDPFTAVGDPTEGALVVAAASMGLRKNELEKSCPRVAEAPFDSDRKRMTTIHRLTASGLPEFLGTLGITPAAAMPFAAFCKGATDGLLGVCREVWMPNGVQALNAESRSAILAANDRLAQSGMRVLGVAFRLLAKPGKESEAEQDLIFLGLIGMIDPPRQEVKVAVQTCKAAGIRPVMITGDHPLTAREIARQLGIASDGEILTGPDLDKLSVDELGAHVEKVSVYARVSPEHKLKIIEALQKHGHVVAMTGDGVNDAPALRKADIGVAMGITGTDVAKEASDMVLRDDNFATIVAAIEEGRTIYDNIRKFIKYMLSTNSGELWTMLMAPIVGLPLPLLPIQILWMNLVTDGLPALALGVEPAERDVMRRKPRRATDNIFGEGLGLHIVWVGILMAVVTLGIGYWYSKLHQWDLTTAADLAHYRTMIFTIMAGLQMGQVLAIRSSRRSLFSMGLRSNLALTGSVALTLALQVALVYTPFLQKFFQTVSLSASDLIVCIVMSSVVFWAVELEKLGRRWKTRIKAAAAAPKCKP
ncbi:MAG: cation-translocating P-type ATPase [Kiritimatiellae bacterium]|nr:cation-translocating P-type ATPase [Kiritimatiellia bacterium]